MVTNHPGPTLPERTAGTRPARTTLDFPLPDPPTTSVSRGAASVVIALAEFVDEVVATVEVRRIRLVERPEPLERIDADVHRLGLGRQRRRDGSHELLDRVARCIEHRPHRTLDMIGESGLAPLDTRSEDGGEVGSIVTPRRRTDDEVREEQLTALVDDDVVEGDPAVLHPSGRRIGEGPTDAQHEVIEVVTDDGRTLDPSAPGLDTRTAGHDERGSRLAPVVADPDDGRVVERRDALRIGLERLHEPGLVDAWIGEHADDHRLVTSGEARLVHRSVRADSLPASEAVSAEWFTCRFGQIEAGVMAQDSTLQVGQCWRRIESDLVGERRAIVAIRAQRIDLTTRPVQRQHQLAAEPFPQRMLRHQCLEPCDRLGGAATGELGFDELLDGDQAQLLDALCLREHPLLVGELRIRVATPHVECLPKRHRGERGIAGAELTTPLVQQDLEAVHVDPRSEVRRARTRVLG